MMYKVKANFLDSLFVGKITVPPCYCASVLIPFAIRDFIPNSPTFMETTHKVFQ